MSDFQRTESLLTRLIVFIISTGALTSAFALVSLILVSMYPDTLLYVAFFVCVSRRTYTKFCQKLPF